MKPIRYMLTAALSFWFASSEAQVARQAKVEQKELHGAEAARIIPGADYIQEGLNTAYPSFVRLNQKAGVPAKTIVSWLKKTIKCPATVDFKLVKQDHDNLGFDHYRYIQTFRQIPIDKTTYLVHAKEGTVRTFNGLALNVPAGLQAMVNLSEPQALQMALKYIGADKYKWESEFWTNDLKKRAKDQKATYFPKGELCWSVSPDNRIFRLAYRFDISSASPDKVQRIYVDARSGEKVQLVSLETQCNGGSVNTIHNGTRNISTDKYTANDFRLRNDCQTATVHVRDWNSTTCTANPAEIQNTTNSWSTTNERFGGTALWAIMESYNYFLAVHSRKSYNDTNGVMDCYINAVFDSGAAAGCQAWTDNATMHVTPMLAEMKIGLGSSGTLANSSCQLDVVAHEYAHAVTGTSANLVYSGESGALNESFSDIFGEMVENRTLGTNDWLSAGERTGGANRSLADPKSLNQPDTYMGQNWASTGPNDYDYGGVHINSGVQNHWFYLLVNGGLGSNDYRQSYSISGIGMAKARAIAYRNLTEYLVSNSDYAAARTGAIQAAIDLFGPCSNEVTQTTNAWYAVGVGDRAFSAVASVTSRYITEDVSCHNACDGAVTVTVFSATNPTYSWSGPGGSYTGQSVSGLCPGTYTVTVTDLAGTGCSTTASVPIQNVPLLTVSTTVTSNYNGYNISCNGGSNGTAIANAAGGLPNVFTGYKYLWNNSQTISSATGLSATTYTVTVSDMNGCTATGSVSLTQPAVLHANAAASSNYNGFNISCHGGSNGTATATPSGGVAPYTYSWSNTQTTGTATNLSAASYTVTVTDANGCTSTETVTLTEPPLLTATTSPTSNYNGYNVRCYGGNDGSAEAYPTGGVPPYTYSWSPSGQSSRLASNLSATTYAVTITDANACSTSANTTLTEPPALTIDAGTNASVYYGYPDSACTKLTATGMGGGVSPTTLNWSTASTASSINVCPTVPTTYSVTISDKNNCSVTDMVKVCVIDVRCGNSLDNVELCHNTGSTANPTTTLCVTLAAAKNLIAHGDQLAACGTSKTCISYTSTARLGRGGENEEQGGLLTAFPNPFSGFTTVRFQIPQEENVSLKLYDMSGREISQLYSGLVLGEHPYDFHLDGAGYSAGLYFLILKTENGETYVSKLLLTR